MFLESSGGWHWETAFKLGGKGGAYSKRGSQGENRDYAVDLASVNNNIENRVMSNEHNPVSGLKCVSLNARSIVNKMGELRHMVEDVEPGIIGITETWTRPDMGTAEFSLK